MRSNNILRVAIAGIVVMAGVAVYHNFNAPVIQKFKLEIQLIPASSDIGNISITNVQSYTYNIQDNYFNVSLTGYVNYTVKFSFNVVYGYYYNTTTHVYLQGNISVTFKTNNGSATPGPIYIS